MTEETKKGRSEIAIGLIITALVKAEEKYPGWPDDIVHASAILNEEAGELTQAALDYFYGRHPTKERMMKEAAQVGAMALRFLIDILKEFSPEQIENYVTEWREIK